MHAEITDYVVHKLGGSSLADAQQLMTTAALLHGKQEVIVVSAIKGTTSLLQQLLDQAAAHQADHAALDALEARHTELVQALLLPALAESLLADYQQDFADIRAILQVVDRLGGYSSAMQDRVLGFGEPWAAKLLAAYLALKAKSVYLDAASVVIVKGQHPNITVDWQQTEAALQAFLAEHPFDQLIVPGFIARTFDGQFTTLGRNGSDYSAAIFAKLFAATELIIWTDVDGVFSADPKKVPAAFVLNELSYEEALELAYFGAKVLHPKMIAPAMEANIPIIIRNSMNPAAKGTRIAAQRAPSPYLLQGITSIDDIALINIEGSGLLGVSGVAARVFSVMQQANISVILITQASSEHSICFAISEAHVPEALRILHAHFQFELAQQHIQRIQAHKGCAIISAVGDDMVGTPGIAGKFCDTLAKANVNIRAIAQGSSERNISLVVNKIDSQRALRAVHARFYRSHKTLAIGLIGPGLVGATLLQQFHQARQYLQEKYQVELCVRGIMNSRQMLLSQVNIDLPQWQDALQQSLLTANLTDFAQHVLADDMPHGVIIDCTADQTVVEHYLDFIQLGLHIITPNKRANSGDWDFYQQLKATTQRKNRHYLYETTVCAGLPIINTLQDIVKTGDEVVSITGVVSGTLSYIFNELSGGDTFTTIVKRAKQLGYTEPDPRDDLSGKDVARKMVCLAREIGLSTTMDDVAVHDLVPAALQSCSVDEFLARLPEHEGPITELLQQAQQQQQKLVYAGSIHRDGTIQVSIQSLPLTHPLARLKGTDNMLIFYTRRYHDQPLVIQGPGAGAEVTAAGIFADVLRLVSYLSE